MVVFNIFVKNKVEIKNINKLSFFFYGGLNKERWKHLEY